MRFFSRLVLKYEQSLKRSPIMTNAITTGTLFGVGDVVAQNVFNDDINTGEVKGKTKQGYDWARTSRAVTYGFVIFAPIGTKWYIFLNSKIKLSNISTIKSPKGDLFMMVAVDQLLFAPLAIPFYFSCLSIMERASIHDAKNKLDQLWWNTLITNWKIWPAFQLLNFSIIPLQHRLMAVNVLALFWNIFLSYENSRVTSTTYKKPVYSPPISE